jgi:hypothetical protein
MTDDIPAYFIIATLLCLSLFLATAIYITFDGGF